MNLHHRIKQLVVKEFFPKRSDFPENDRIGYLLSHCVTKTHKIKHKIKSQLKYKFVCRRVVQT